MPKKSRVDAPGAPHHIICREIALMHGRPSLQALCLRLDDQIAKPSDEKITILIVTEYLAALNAPGNDMMQRTR